MRTIGKHWSHGKREGAGCCGICGVRYPMSMLRKNADGTWCCPDDIDGLTATEIAEREAAAADSLDDGDIEREMASYDRVEAP